MFQEIFGLPPIERNSASWADEIVYSSLNGLHPLARTTFWEAKDTVLGELFECISRLEERLVYKS